MINARDDAMRPLAGIELDPHADYVNFNVPSTKKTPPGSRQASNERAGSLYGSQSGSPSKDNDKSANPDKSSGRESDGDASK